MFTATVVMYTMSATHWALGVQAVRNEYNNGHPLLLFLDRKREPHRPRGGFHATTTILFVQLLVAIVNIILSDIIVLWRASVVWSRNVFVIAISIAFVITIPVFYIISVIVGVLAYLNEIQHVVVVVFFAVAFVLSLVSNICATMLITYKAWLLRRRIGKYLQNAGRGSAVEGVMALLVESGALYCAIWLIGIVSGFASGSREFFICFVASIAQVTVRPWAFLSEPYIV
ncbi:hypothetical protein OF83DRAFT_658746 [Amylostereum chailletii]|nr:hypothetical protein OF83DRAFT_658746 [Amylostereum chailletii]